MTARSTVDSNGEGPRPLKVFCSYAREDQPFLRKLRTHLAGLERQKLITWWDDRELLPGTDWDGVIKETVKSADIILFLLSADFLYSEYCIDTEVEIALNRRKDGDATVVPILVRSVDFDGSVFATIRMLPPGVVPVERWESPDDAYTEISREIRRLATQWTWGPRAAERFWDVPARIDGLVGRDTLVEQLAGAFALQRQRRVVALVGAGGVGKTSVAAEYAWANRDRYDLVAWLHAEDESGLDWEYARLADRVGLPSTNLHAAKTAFRDWLAGPARWHEKGWLLVFDNATDEEMVRRLLPEPMSGHALITSREAVWQGLGEEIHVGGLAEADAVRYVLDATGSRDERAARALAAEVRGIPLSLSQAVATIREDRVALGEYVVRHRDPSAR